METKKEQKKLYYIKHVQTTKDGKLYDDFYLVPADSNSTYGIAIKNVFGRGYYDLVNNASLSDLL